MKSFSLSANKPYTLSDRWIIRNDPYFHTPYLAFNIDTAEKYKISLTLFLILKLFENNYLSFEQICSFCSQRGIEITVKDIIKVISKHFNPSEILTDNFQNSKNISDFELTSIKSYVPVTSTPYEAEVHFTRACNLYCKHCIYKAGKKLDNELELISWLNIFDQFEKLRTYRIAISGGEPLLYPGSGEIIDYLAQKRIRIELLTNGTLIDKSLALLLSRPNFSTTVSLDGANCETHELLRGPDSFRKVINGLELLSKAGAKFHIATTVNKKNIHQLKSIAELAYSIGAESINFLVLDALGRAKNHKEFLLENSDINNISNSIDKLKNHFEGKIYIGYLNPYEPKYEDLKPLKNSRIFCTAGTTRLAIRSDGIVFPCVYAFHDNHFAMGSTKENEIKEIWELDSWELFRGSVELSNLSECSNCSFVNSCDLKMCRLRAYYSKNDFFGTPPGCRKKIQSNGHERR